MLKWQAAGRQAIFLAGAQHLLFLGLSTRDNMDKGSGSDAGQTNLKQRLGGKVLKTCPKAWR